MFLIFGLENERLILGLGGPCLYRLNSERGGRGALNEVKVGRLLRTTRVKISGLSNEVGAPISGSSDSLVLVQSARLVQICALWRC